jgi:hypothetical protein
MPSRAVASVKGPVADGKAAPATRASPDAGRKRGSQDRSMSREEETRLPLVRCRDCDSPLLQLEHVAGPIDGQSIVTRFCPDCERRDTVFAGDKAVQVWLRRERRITSRMAEYADELAERLAAGTLDRTGHGGLR